MIARNFVCSLILGVVVVICFPGTINAQIFTDDFEKGTLENWVVGGRQLAGDNIADVVTRHGSLMGHLFKFSFTEIDISRDFVYSPELRFNFDLEVTASSTPPPTPAYYGMARVVFVFLDADGEGLGYVWYGTATTSYPFDNAASNPVAHFAEISPDVLHHFSLDVSEILPHIDIDETQITSVKVYFSTYSSTHPSPTVTAELWVDNFCVDSGHTCGPYGEASLDVDGNGVADALSDGILITRYLFGFRGDTLVVDAVAPDCTRCTSDEIEDWIRALVP